MSAQMQLKILSFDDYDVFAALHAESALYMIGAVDEVKESDTTQQQEEKKNNVSTDAA